MTTNFFQNITSLNVPGIWKIGISTDEQGNIKITGLFNIHNNGTQAAKVVPPFIMSGTAEELDNCFFDTISKPVQETAGVFHNMEDYRKGLEKAKTLSKATADKPAKSNSTPTGNQTDHEMPDPKAEKKKAYDATIKTINGLSADCKYEEAIALLPAIEEYPETKDNRTFFAGSGDTLSVWDIANSKRPLLKTWLGYFGIESIAISPDGKTLAMGSWPDIAIYDIASRRLVRHLKQSGEIRTLQFVDNHTLIASGYYENDSIFNKEHLTLQEWDTEKGVVINNYMPGSQAVNTFQLLKNETLLAAATTDGILHFWNLQDGSEKGYHLHTGIIRSIYPLPEPNKIITSADDTTITLFDFAQRQLRSRITPQYGQMDKLFPFGKGDTAVCVFWNNELRLLDSRNLTFLPSRKLRVGRGIVMDMARGDHDRIYSAFDSGSIFVTPLSAADKDSAYFDTGQGYILSNFEFSKDLKFGLSGSFDKTAVVVDLDKQVSKGIVSKNFDRGLAFSTDNRLVALGKVGYDIQVFDWQKAQLKATLPGHQNTIPKLAFFDQDRKLLSCSVDNTLKIWDVSRSKEIATLLSAGLDDYIILLPNGYYKATKKMVDQLSFSLNDRLVRVSQLDIRYNRPDKVLQTMGSADTSLINAFAHAYQKRLHLLGIDSSRLTENYTNVPSLDISNKNAIASKLGANRLLLHLQARSDQPLDRLNIWINQVPVFGLKGFNLRTRHTKILDTSITVTLSAGQNYIEASVINTGGVESFRSPLPVFCAKAPARPQRLYFIGVGAEKFADQHYNLQWSRKDIRDLANKFKKKFGAHCIIDTLFDAAVSNTTLRALKAHLRSASVEDIVVIAYSGHGLFSSNYDYYLSSYHVNFEHPEQNGIAYETFANLLDSIPPRKKLMLIDACNSGEIDKTEMVNYQKEEPKLQKMGVSKGLIVLKDTRRKVGLKSSFELMRDMFINAGNNTGATIISAAGGTQFALEKNGLKNGVFTYSVLEYLSRRHCTVGALNGYVNGRVSALTAGLQVPTTRNEVNGTDWYLW